LKEWSFPFGVNATVLITKDVLLIKLTVFALGSRRVSVYVILDFIMCRKFFNWS